MDQPSLTGDAGPAASAGTRLPHLSGEGAAIRQVVAAHFLRDCAEVIEIGGAGLPISGFLTHRPVAVTVIDPKIDPYTADTLNGAPCRVRHLAAKVQGLALAPTPGRYGLVLLGLSLKPFGRRPALDDTVMDLARNARVVVLDYALALDRAAGQVPELLSGMTVRVDLVMRLADERLAASGFAERRLLVMTPAAATSQAAHE